MAVNVDTGESDVRGLSAEEIEATARDLRFRVLSLSAPVAKTIRESRMGRELWRLLLLAGVLAVVAEALLARHISRHKTRTALTAKNAKDAKNGESLGTTGEPARGRAVPSV